MLFTQVTGNTQHFLYLLPPQREQHYYLRERPHSYQISTLKDKNFLIRMLYKDLGCSQRDTNFLFLTLHQQHFVCCAIKLCTNYYYYFYYPSRL